MPFGKQRQSRASCATFALSLASALLTSLQMEQVCDMLMERMAAMELEEGTLRCVGTPVPEFLGA